MPKKKGVSAGEPLTPYWCTGGMVHDASVWGTGFEAVPLYTVRCDGPDTRKTVELGKIVIDKAVADSGAEEQALLFLPAALPDGIEPADPMITARSEA